MLSKRPKIPAREELEKQLGGGVSRRGGAMMLRQGEDSVLGKMPNISAEQIEQAKREEEEELSQLRENTSKGRDVEAEIKMVREKRQGEEGEKEKEERMMEEMERQRVAEEAEMARDAEPAGKRARGSAFVRKEQQQSKGTGEMIKSQK